MLHVLTYENVYFLFRFNFGAAKTPAAAGTTGIFIHDVPLVRSFIFEIQLENGKLYIHVSLKIILKNIQTLKFV